ncbi:MAG TPA: hypothetical protein VHT91_39410 [Kofleriaceae bacterium]|nr:hypothetical protein [Kofleriaceae bacterium]
MDGQTRRDARKAAGVSSIVDDIFTAHRGEMTAVIREARRRAGPG